MDAQPPSPVSDQTTAIWPRRASKACASCRRDKIRCDGARPCSNCTKKGYGTDRCIDGCEPCRRARVRCENGKPCSRCREMHLECVEEIASAPPRQDTSNMLPRISRGGTERAKLACTNCRRDNKKCDDQRPCSRCIARSEECIHIARGPKLVKLRCEGCRQENKRCEDSRPCKYCVESEKECVAVPRKGRGHGTRVKAACMSCRRDKIRCDGVRPCAACVRKGCECIERACKACSRDGKAADCTHRKPQDAGLSDTGESPIESHPSAQVSSSSGSHQNYGPGPPQIPQHDFRSHHITQNHDHSMYPPMAHMQHYYYPSQHPPQHSDGMAQGPPPMMQNPMYMPKQSERYYSIIDPHLSASVPPVSHVPNSTQ